MAFCEICPAPNIRVYFVKEITSEKGFPSHREAVPRGRFVKRQIIFFTKFLI
jgi:hypothetical protein